MRTLIQYSEGIRNIQYDLSGSLKIEALGGNLTYVGQCEKSLDEFYYQDGLELSIVRSTKFPLETR